MPHPDQLAQSGENPINNLISEGRCSMKTTVSVALAAILLSPWLATAAEKHEDAEKKAVESAEAWLALVDQAKYGEAWDTASEYLKNAVSKEDFAKSLGAARKPLGKVKSRELKSKQYATSLPGTPDGEYVVIQYKTAFENKKAGVETITPMLDKDKKWRVSGYFIK
jgi:hypothetical protein